VALGSHRRIDSSMPGKETSPHAPYLVSFVPPPPSIPPPPERPCRLSQPSLSLFLPIQSAQPPTHHLRPLSYRLVFRPSPTPWAAPLCIPPSPRLPHPPTHRLPSANPPLSVGATFRI